MRLVKFCGSYSALQRGKLIQFHSRLVRGEDRQAKAALISHISVTINCISKSTKPNHFLLHSTQTHAFVCTNTHPLLRSTIHWLLQTCTHPKKSGYLDFYRCVCHKGFSEKWHDKYDSGSTVCRLYICVVRIGSCSTSKLTYLWLTGQRCVCQTLKATTDVTGGVGVSGKKMIDSLIFLVKYSKK